MNYKSLIFAEKRPKRVISPDVISDLKLNLILPPEVTDVLLYKPERDTLLYRHELFEKLLKRQDSVRLLREISEALSLAGELYTALNRATSVPASSFIFVHLFAALAEFAEKAVTVEDAGFLYDRFAEALRTLSLSEEFKSAREEALSLTEELAKINEITLSTEGESTKVIRTSEICISEKLKACAAELNIPLSEKREKPISLQKGVAEALARLYPAEFERARGFYDRYRILVQGELFDYISELEFIIGILDFTRLAAENGIPYTFPALTEKRGLDFKNVYDVTLIKKEGTVIVPNDVFFSENEPFFYLTGANGGGKTTFIRALGVSALFFLAGAPVFAENGEGQLLSSVFTHFPRDERFEGSGRFVDEERRVNEILQEEDGNALILLNETYSTTGEEKAVKCTEELAERLYKSGSFGVYITHQHSVSETEIPFLSVVIDRSDSNRRTYKIEKRRTESLSFARDILKKYGLTEEALRERFGIEEK